MTVLRYLAIAVLPLATLGCVSKPTMKLNHAEITGVQFGFPLQIGVVMNVVMDIYNPNSYDVAVRAVRGQTTLAERFVLPVDFRADQQGIWLPAKQTTTIAVPVTVPVQTGLAVLSTIYNAPSVTYRFTGAADVTATRTLALEKDDYSVDERGEIPRQQFEQALRFALPGARLSGRRLTERGRGDRLTRMRFPISITHNFLLEPIMHTFGARPEVSYAEIGGGELEVRMGVWFHEKVPLSSISAIAPSDWPWWGGLGVKLAHHGVGVVGSTEGVVSIHLKKPQKVRVLVEVECTQLWVSLEDRDGFLRALSQATSVPISEPHSFSAAK